jgi:hypothetical protein
MPRSYPCACRPSVYPPREHPPSLLPPAPSYGPRPLPAQGRRQKTGPVIGCRWALFVPARAPACEESDSPRNLPLERRSFARADQHQVSSSRCPDTPLLSPFLLLSLRRIPPPLCMPGRRHSSWSRPPSRLCSFAGRELLALPPRHRPDPPPCPASLLLLSLPMQSVTLAAALSFLVSVLVLFVSQSNVRGKAYRRGWEALADVYAQICGGLGGGRGA